MGVKLLIESFCNVILNNIQSYRLIMWIILLQWNIYELIKNAKYESVLWEWVIYVWRVHNVGTVLIMVLCMRRRWVSAGYIFYLPYHMHLTFSTGRCDKEHYSSSHPLTLHIDITINRNGKKNIARTWVIRMRHTDSINQPGKRTKWHSIALDIIWITVIVVNWTKQNVPHRDAQSMIKLNSTKVILLYEH